MKQPIEDGWNSLVESGAVDMFPTSQHHVLRWMFFAGASFMFSHIVELTRPTEAELDQFRDEVSARADQTQKRKRKVQ